MTTPTPRIWKELEQQKGDWSQMLKDALAIGDLREGAAAISLSQLSGGVLTVEILTGNRNRRDDYHVIKTIALSATGATLIYLSTGLGSYLWLKGSVLDSSTTATWEALWQGKRG